MSVTFAIIDEKRHEVRDLAPCTIQHYIMAFPPKYPINIPAMAFTISRIIVIVFFPFSI